MFKKHSLQVKMIKDDDEATEVCGTLGPFEVKVEIVADQVKSVLVMIGGGVLAYVLADTVRQVAIEKAKH